VIHERPGFNVERVTPQGHFLCQPDVDVAVGVLKAAYYRANSSIQQIIELVQAA
jgi:hypothetical protein